MILRQRLSSRRNLTAVTGFAVASVAISCLYPAAARAQEPAGTPQSEPPASTLDLPLDTGKPSAETPAPAASNGAGTVIVHRAMSGGNVTQTPSRQTQPLASRGVTPNREAFRQSPAAAPRVLAQLGLVTATQLPLRVERSASAQSLSSVPKGTYLAVVADGGDWWGVLMVNNTMGWAPKSALQMIAYQTEIQVPSNPLAQGNSGPATADSGAAGSVAGGVADGLDPRTSSLLRNALSYLGVPYVWAGNTRAGLDCSGFVKAVFAAQGVALPRHSGDQAKIGQPVAGADVRPGDRLYFDMGRKGEISHCGIYLGNGYFIHASTNHGHVDIDSIFKPNYYKALVSIRRS